MKKTTTILSAHSIIQKLCPMRSRGLAALAAAFGFVLSTGLASAVPADWTDGNATNDKPRKPRMARPGETAARDVPVIRPDVRR